MALRDLDFKFGYGPEDDRLHSFYIPMLKASVRYDRMTGFFSSHALAIAASGIAHLIANHGQMRLLVGAQLSHEDVQAIEAGYDLQAMVASQMQRAIPDDPNSLTAQLRDRLAGLAWMVAHGTLEIRVVLPKDPRSGLPLPAPESRDYFHPKVGIFTDAQGDQIAFSGSINESDTGWQHNYEHFMVYSSWADGRVYLAEARGRFARLWEYREPGWISLPVPDAARQKLLRYTPSKPPAHDSLERMPKAIVKQDDAVFVLEETLRYERVVCQFLRDIPHLINGSGIGAATSAIEPWPHQRSVAKQVVESYPSRYLFCDEVGLGKTIEAGLVLRDLWLRGVVKRALILAPKSVLRQWQEELYEKFSLNVPIFDGRGFFGLWGQECPITTPNPWDSVELALASSQLVKREDRQQRLVEAQPWDLVLVDEAHHARRKDFLDLRTYRPNRLLELLNNLQARTAGMLLLTATPMQVHSIEVWDLLNLLGLSGEWGADGRNFLRFYECLQSDDPDWDFLLRMFRAELVMREGCMDPDAVTKGRRSLGPVDWASVQKLLGGQRLEDALRNSGDAFHRLALQAQVVVKDLVSCHTPLRRLVFRNTRPLLRDYVQRGLLNDRVPERSPKLVWIGMQPDERKLYRRIEEYISDFYRKYEEERKGLGFVMTVYRRRLTSSFYAVWCSLERRLSFLRGQSPLEVDEDDFEQAALTFDVDEPDVENRASYFAEEIRYVEDFLHELRMLGDYDSKVKRLLSDLRQVFRERETALIFTQYTDTLDFLREQLREAYGRQVACYSGRGGEWWDGNAWVPISKEELKNAFRQGEEIKILLATDAASEGLNLQTCGVLINYDMPWNPMRVEQRIGRVDRIGQRYETVWILNYFYEDTIEASVYRALQHRIDWFQAVVGKLQPILARVGQKIQELALTGAEKREDALLRALDELEEQLDDLAGGLDLDAWSGQAGEDAFWSTPVGLSELESVCLSLPTLRQSLTDHEDIAGAFWLKATGKPKVAVTFKREVFDQYPYSLRLLTFGTPEWGSLLTQVSQPETEDMMRLGIQRFEVENPLNRVAYYAVEPAAQLQSLNRLDEVLKVCSTPSIEHLVTDVVVEKGQSALQQAVEAEWLQIANRRARLRQAQWDALVAKAARLLLDAALIELALGQQPGLLGDGGYPQAFNENAVRGLRRHNYPWAPLLHLTWNELPLRKPVPTDPFFVKIQGLSAEKLKHRFNSLKPRAIKLVKSLSELKVAM